MKYPDRFPAFVHQMQSRLRRGAEVYGDRTFEQPTEGIIAEIQEELVDVCGWAYCAWLQLEQSKHDIRTSTEVQKPADGLPPGEDAPEPPRGAPVRRAPSDAERGRNQEAPGASTTAILADCE